MTKTKPKKPVSKPINYIRHNEDGTIDIRVTDKSTGFDMTIKI